MGTFATGALANIQEAARRIGIDKDRIQDILGTAPAASGVAWDDGALQLIAPTYAGVAAASTDLVTSNGHGLPNGTLVKIIALTGGTGLTLNGLYYVRDTLTNTFGLALTPTGAKVDIEVDASAISVRRVANTHLVSIVREAFRQRGLYQDKADQFIASITALDTGLNGTITVPDLEDLRWTTAIKALVDAGFVGGTITASDEDDAWDIGTVTDTQLPVAAATAVLGDNVVAFTVQGVPDINDVALLAAVTDLEDVGLVINGLGDEVEGTVDVSEDVITVDKGHGLADGDRVLISAISGATGFTAGNIVYIHSLVEGEDVGEGEDLVEATEDTLEVETIIGEDDGAFGGEDGTISLRKLDPADIAYVDPDGAAVDDAIATDPEAGEYLGLDPGDAVDLTVGGVAVPTWSEDGSGDDGAQTKAEYDVLLAAANLSADGTAGAAGTLGAVTSSDPAEGTFVAKGSVVSYTYTTAAD
jgi:hypothetical protein